MDQAASQDEEGPEVVDPAPRLETEPHGTAEYACQHMPPEDDEGRLANQDARWSFEGVQQRPPLPSCRQEQWVHRQQYYGQNPHAPMKVEYHVEAKRPLDPLEAGAEHELQRENHEAQQREALA